MLFTWKHKLSFNPEELQLQIEKAEQNRHPFLCNSDPFQDSCAVALISKKQNVEAAAETQEEFVSKGRRNRYGMRGTSMLGNDFWILKT